MDNYKVYTSEIIPGFGIPLLISTLVVHESGRWVFEMHLLIYNNEGCAEREVIKNKYYLDSSEWPTDNTELDEELIESIIKEQAQIELSNLLEEKNYFEKNKAPIKIDFKQTGRQPLIRLLMYGKCNNQLMDIAAITSSSKLRHFFDAFQTVSQIHKAKNSIGFS